MLRKINQTFTIQLSKISKADKINSLLIIAIWIVMVILVNPWGDFPLNDDWVYGLSVKYLLENGDFKLPSSASSNVFSQVFWGALFCLPFGFSFTALHFSTLVLGLIGVLTTYAIFRQLKTIPVISLLGALLIALNPVYFVNANTFMTDVPFFTCAVLSLYFLIYGIRKNSKYYTIFGLIVSYIALLIRQVGIVISLGFGVGYLTQKGVSFKNIFVGFFPLFIACLIQVSYQKWLIIGARVHNVSNPQYSQFFIYLKNIIKNPFHFFNSIRSISLFILLYLGFFLFPFVLIFFWRSFCSYRPKTRLIILSVLSFFVTLVVTNFIVKNRSMPLLINILDDFGLGPLTLRDTYLLNINYPLIPLTIRIFWLVITGISIIGAGLLIYYLILGIIQNFPLHKNSNNSEKKALTNFLLSATLVYFPLIILTVFFDRYLLPLLPLCMLIIILTTPDIPRWNFGHIITSVVLIFMLIYGGFTISTTHDYLAWNRTRWQALNNLMKEDNISPNLIDGGYEFNGWYLYDVSYKAQPDKSFWWVDKDDYMISSGPMKGYNTVKQYPFRRWFLGREDSIFVLRKSAGSNSP